MTGYVMTLKNGDRYTLDEDGFVIARTDGPKGWDYGRGWRILGFKKRAHSRATIPIDAAVDGADVGQGWVLDEDHGTVRLWGSPSARKLARIERNEGGQNDR